MSTPVRASDRDLRALAAIVSEDRPDLSRRVWFTNRFTRLAPNWLPFIPGTAEDVIAVPTAPSQRIPAANATQARADSGLTV